MVLLSPVWLGLYLKTKTATFNIPSSIPQSQNEEEKREDKG
jgi:hypothetical protein